MNEKDTLYARWLSGELSPNELEKLKASGELEELETIIKVMDQATLPAYDLDGAYKQFKTKHPAKSAKVRTISRAMVLGIAAGIALLIAAFFLLRNPHTELIAQNGNTLEHQFLDGSEVLLNDGSLLRYLPEDWSEARTVELDGEAYFEVVKGNRFTVNTPNGQVEVLGTSFNVKARNKGLRVECFTGKVKVRGPKQDSIILTKGEAAVLKGGNLQDAILDHQSPLWKQGVSRFYAEEIEAVFHELERQYDISIAAPNINKSFSGEFNHDSLEVALLKICTPHNLEFKISEDQKSVIITAKK